MELHDTHNHHADATLIYDDQQVDRYGQPILFKGQGFKHGRIYQEIEERAGLVEKIWIEDASGLVLFEAKRRDTLEQVMYLRDTAFPDASVHAYRGQHQAQRRCDDPDWGKGFEAVGVTVYPPKKQKREVHTSKPSRKIKRAFK